jgi:hypothetical protein
MGPQVPKELLHLNLYRHLPVFQGTPYNTEGGVN